VTDVGPDATEGVAEAAGTRGATHGSTEAVRPLEVLIADDQALVRAGFRMILEAQPDIRVVAEAADGEAAVRLAARHRPDVVLMDIRMPGLDGLEATRRILGGGAGGGSRAAASMSAPRVIVLTTFDVDEYVYAALQSGASGFLLKDVTPEQLVAAVRTVSVGDALLAPTITRRLVERFARPAQTPAGDAAALETLTTREREVFGLLARGMSNAEIADALVVGEATVKSHVAAILAKLGLRNRAQAVVLAYESGLIRAATPSA
jgi:DNA-binding NarL/FixJ family response regulator